MYIVRTCIHVHRDIHVLVYTSLHIAHADNVYVHVHIHVLYMYMNMYIHAFCELVGQALDMSVVSLQAPEVLKDKQYHSNVSCA